MIEQKAINVTAIRGRSEDLPSDASRLDAPTVIFTQKDDRYTLHQSPGIDYMPHFNKITK